MPRRCSICTHAQRKKIDAALVNRSVSYRAIAGRYGLSRTSLQRHADGHLADDIAVAENVRAVRHGRSLGDYLVEQVEQAVEIRDGALEAAPTDDAAMARWTAASHVAMKGMGLMVRVGEALQRSLRK